MLKFPTNFTWGAATAPEECEGRGPTKKGKTVWDACFSEFPEMFYQGVGTDLTCDFGSRYKADLKMFATMKMQSLRLGFSWARLFPDGEHLDPDAVAFYHDVIREATNNKIQLFMTAFHFDMPLWAQNLGGFESREVITKYAQYVAFLCEEYGNSVDYIVTMNEPIVPVLNGYHLQKHWPMVDDPKRLVQAGYGTVLAHAKAVNLYNEKYRDKIRAKIGVVINITPAYPKDGKNFTPADQEAADVFNMLHNYSMLDPMVKGVFPPGLFSYLTKEQLLPNYLPEELVEISRVKIDFLGINYYFPTRVQHNNNPVANHFWERVAQPYVWDKARLNVFRGWEIFPEAFGDIANVIKERYGNLPWFVSENGMGVQQEWLYKNAVGEIQDDYRIAFLYEHLEHLHRAIAEGANCFGYHMWAVFDCWSWANAFKNTYGFIEIDFKENLKRRFKKSAFWMKNVITTNALPAKPLKIEDFMDLRKVKHIKSL